MVVFAEILNVYTVKNKVVINYMYNEYTLYNRVSHNYPLPTITFK